MRIAFLCVNRPWSAGVSQPEAADELDGGYTNSSFLAACAQCHNVQGYERPNEGKKRGSLNSMNQTRSRRPQFGSTPVPAGAWPSAQPAASSQQPAAAAAALSSLTTFLSPQRASHTRSLPLVLQQRTGFTIPAEEDRHVTSSCSARPGLHLAPPGASQERQYLGQDHTADLV